MTIRQKYSRNDISIFFIRPVLEYASVVWHNAPRLQKYCTKLEQLQLDAAGTVAGTNRIASKQLLYCEKGCKILSD